MMHEVIDAEAQYAAYAFVFSHGDNNKSEGSNKPVQVQEAVQEAEKQVKGQPKKCHIFPSLHTNPTLRSPQLTRKRKTSDRVVTIFYLFSEMYGQACFTPLFYRANHRRVWRCSCSCLLKRLDYPTSLRVVNLLRDHAWVPNAMTYMRRNT